MATDKMKVVAVNFGSTSTKIAYYENDKCVVNENLSHSSEEINKLGSVAAQYDLRKGAILDFMAEHGIRMEDLDSFTTRGGLTEPIVGGTYRINEAMVEQTESERYGKHVCNLGSRIAYDLCTQEGVKAIALTSDTPNTDEFAPIARFSGLKEIGRRSCFQALNQKAMSRHYAESQGKRYEDMNFVTVMLGGGISVVAHEKGRMVDGPDAIEGEGPFSNNRCGTVPAGALVRMCYSGEYSLEQMMRKINGDAGLISYLGTTDVREIECRIAEGDSYAAEVLDAMCYQTAKEVGAYATVLKGEVDAIILTGGMANSKYITERIRERVEYIAPVTVLAGEREMESLCLNSYRALKGEIPILKFEPR